MSTAAAARGIVDVAIVGGGMTGAALAAALGEERARQKECAAPQSSPDLSK